MIFFTSNKTPIGSIEIKFYGKNKIFVNYSPAEKSPGSIEGQMIELFALYYAKMLYNLGKCPEAEDLLYTIRDVMDRSMKKAFAVHSQTGEIAIVKSEIKRPKVLQSNQKLLKQEPKEQPDKIYKGKLYQRRDGSLIILTDMSWGEEDYYAPLSIRALLQHLINSLSKESLSYLMTVLFYMHHYYQEIGEYFNMKSIIEAPHYAFICAAEFFGAE